MTKIACICVTENRAPIWGIALASFLTQRHMDKHLFVVVHQKEEQAYRAAAAGFERHPCMDQVTYLIPSDGWKVPERIDIGVDAGFKFGGVCAMWDDDDWSPVDRLSKTAEIASSWENDLPRYASYAQGWFCNLRTLRGELVRTLPAHLWGGTLAFNHRAWVKGGRFATKPFPGQDRAFMTALKECHSTKEYRLQRGRGEPVAFSHGKNVATWLKSKGSPMEGFLRGDMPELVMLEVKRCQQLMIDTRTHPPQPEK